MGALNLKYVLQLKETISFFGVDLSPTIQGVLLSSEPVILGLLATPLAIRLVGQWGVNGLWKKSAVIMGLLASGIILVIPNSHNFLSTFVAHAVFGVTVLPAFMMLPDILIGKLIALVSEIFVL